MYGHRRRTYRRATGRLFRFDAVLRSAKSLGRESDISYADVMPKLHKKYHLPIIFSPDTSGTRNTWCT